MGIVGPTARLGAKLLFPLHHFSRGKSERSWLGITQIRRGSHLPLLCLFFCFWLY